MTVLAVLAAFFAVQLVLTTASNVGWLLVLTALTVWIAGPDLWKLYRRALPILARTQTLLRDHRSLRLLAYAALGLAWWWTLL